MLLAITFTMLAARIAPPHAVGVSRWTWMGIVFVLTNLLLAALRPITRRLTPLVTLMKLTLVFPDQAPPRTKSTLRRSNSRTLLRQMEEAKAEGSTSGEALHGDYLVQLLTEVNEHDRLTRGHSERVRAFAEMIGEELGLGEDDMNKLRWSALLHDVGKLHVPSEILNKNGRPTDEEWQVLSEHPRSGGEMLEPLRDWLGEWVHAADQHHCRWDGNGYPDKLAGKDIALSGRILAVADAYDVMTSTRSYKKPLSAEVARRELTDCAGSQFDPAIVRAFLGISLGRLRAVGGPLAWLANLGMSAQVRIPVSASVGSTGGTAAVASLAIAAAGVGGLVPESIPTTLAMEDTGAAAVVSGGAEAVGLEDESIPITLTAEGGLGPLSFRLGAPTNGLLVSGPSGVALGPDAHQGALVGEASEFAMVYVPEPDFFGQDTFSYEACDRDGECVSATAVVNVESVNDAPRASDDSAITGVDQSVEVDVLQNDVDIDGDRLEIIEVAEPAQGSALVAADKVVYLPASGFVGTDVIGYTVADPDGDRSSAELVVEVTAEPLPSPAPTSPTSSDAPVATDDTITVDEDASVVIDVLANDRAVDDGLVELAGVGTPLHGTASVEDGQVRYQADLDYHGTDTFAYAITDGVNPAVAALVTVTVSPVNDAPEAIAPGVATISETAAIGSHVLTVLSSDPDGDELGFAITAGDLTNRFEIDGNGKVTTRAGLDHEATPSYTLELEVSDGTIAITVIAVVSVADINETPTANDDSGSGFGTNEDNPFTTVSVVANDTDPDGPLGSVVVTVVAQPSTGTLANNGDGTFDYSPAPGWSGSETFTYRITDTGELTSNTATVTIAVAPVNDAPAVTNPGPQVGAEETPFSVQITATDVELDNLSYGATGLPPGLAIDGAGLISGNPSPGTHGSYSITVTVTDDGAPNESGTTTFALDIDHHLVSSNVGDVVVNEVLYNTVSATAPEEFVELHNRSAGAIDLSGWVLTDANLKADGTEQLQYTFPTADHWGSPSTLAPGQTAIVWVVYDGANLPPLTSPASGLEYVVALGGTKLDDAGDDLWLLDSTTRLVDYMAYGGGSQVGTPPDAGLGLWDPTFQAALVTGAAESVAVSPDGSNHDDSACWEPTASGDSVGRCAGAVATIGSVSLGSITTSVGADNNAAVADAGGVYSIDEGASLVLDGSASLGPGTWNWDLDNDGQYDDASGVNPTVPWATLSSLGIGDDGVYPVSVEVDGGVDAASTSLTITNVAPTLSISGAATVSDGGVYTLNLSVLDPGSETISGWTINWGDGTIESVVGNPSSITHTYTGLGFTYDILASATDEDGTVLQNELLMPSYDGDTVFRFDATTGAFAQSFAGPDDPIEAEIGPDGRLYVSGQRSDNVLRYNAETGAFIDEFVAAGSGGLNEPEGLAFGPDGNLYVANYNGNEVLRFDGTTGAYIDRFANAGLTRPYDVLFGPDGNLYVGSYTNDRVVRYNGTTGAQIDVFVANGSGGLNSPEQMVFGPDGNLYIASFDSGEVLRYNGTTGAFMDEFVPFGGPADLDKPTGLAFGPDGHLYVADHVDHVVLRFDGTTGAFLDEYVAPGAGGLTKPDPMTFLPMQQVTVVP